MLWLHEYKTVWRVAVLTLLLVAIMGPWWFSLIMVPSKYPCSNPHIRLEGDYCGMPMPGIWILLGLVTRSIELVVGLVTGATISIDSGYAVFSILVNGLLVILLVLPFFSTLFVIQREAGWSRQVFHLLTCSLAAGAAMLLGLNVSRPPWMWALWGPWLYFGSAASALMLEALTSNSAKGIQLRIQRLG